jgi:hypothetical protein
MKKKRGNSGLASDPITNQGAAIARKSKPPRISSSREQLPALQRDESAHRRDGRDSRAAPC